MTERFLAYPLLFVALLQIGPLLRRDARWHKVQIMQWGVILIAAAVALATRWPASWLALGWGTLVLFVAGPRLLLAVAYRWRMRGQWKGAADLQETAGLLIGGGPGRLCRAQATAWRWAARHELTTALEVLDTLAQQPLPAAARGAVLLGRLWLLVEHRHWDPARALFLQVTDWGSVWGATQARLLGARVFAELGDLPAATRCLQFVALSPSLVRFERPYWITRVRVAALAGDAEDLERLLRQPGTSRRGFERFASYWRARCALAQGNRPEGLRLLARAHALTHPREGAWVRAIRHHLHRAETGTALLAPPRDTAYNVGRETLRLAERQAAPWRALMSLGWPGPATTGLLVVIGLTFLAQLLLPPVRAEQLLLLAGNGPFTITLHEWWRLVTALFLHGGWLHLVFNGIALWIFGSAIERAWGWWRLVLVFLLAGAAGNFASALVERYDLAIGASSGIFGLLGAYAIALWRLNTPAYATLRRGLLGTLLLMVIADFAIGAAEPQIDNLAHVGGFLAGLPLGLLLAPRRQNLGQPAAPPSIVAVS